MNIGKDIYLLAKKNYNSLTFDDRFIDCLS